jgi:hypothetical protein
VNATDEWESSGLNRAMRADYAAMLVAAGRIDRLFSVARDQQFLGQQSDDLRRSGGDQYSGGPLATLDLALEHAITADRPAEIAEFLLARARWERRLAADPVLAARAVDTPLTLPQRSDAQRAVLWQLLVAWEQHAAGGPGAARQTLQHLVGNLTTLDYRSSDRAIPLLLRIGEIDVQFLYQFREKLDENARIDLCRALMGEGKLVEATHVAESVRLFEASRVRMFAEIVRAAAGAGERELAVATVERLQDAMTAVPAVELPLATVRLGGALFRVGETGAAAQAFDAARRDSGNSDDQEDVLGELAREQDDLGLLDAAAETIALMDDTPQVLESHEHHAVALARAGDFRTAAKVIRGIGDSEIFIYRRRAVATVATMLAERGDPTQAVALVDLLLGPGEADFALAGVVRFLAAEDVRPVVDRIEAPYWRASALVDTVLAGKAGDDAARAAIDAVPDPVDQVMVLARYMARTDAIRADTPRFLTEVARRLDQARAEDRWRGFAEVGAIVAAAGLPAVDIFDHARSALLAQSDDAWDDSDNLWQLARIQYAHGDVDGARYTYAAGLAGDEGDRDLRLATLGLIAVAIEQAHSAGPEGVEMAVERAGTDAVRAARHLDSSALREVGADVLQMYVPDPEIVPDSALLSRFIDRGPAEATTARRRIASAFCATWAYQAGLPEQAATVMDRVATLDPDRIEQLADLLADAPPLDGIIGHLRLARAWAELDKGPHAGRALRYAADIAGSLPRADDATRMMLRTARMAQRIGQHDAARDILAKALPRLRDIERNSTRDELLSIVAKVRAALGDIAEAFATAETIEHEAFRGEAFLWAAAHARTSLLERGDLIRRIDNPYWLAIGLILVGAGMRSAGESTTAINAEIQQAMGAVPEGIVRTAVLEVLVEANLAIGDHLGAVNGFARMLTLRHWTLPRLGSELLDAGDREALHSLVLVAAKQPETAFLMCGTLAGRYPEIADQIVADLARSIPDGEPENSEEDSVEVGDDFEEAHTFLTNLTGGVPLTEGVDRALQHAATGGRELIDTADLLQALQAVDSASAWSRLALRMREPSGGDPPDGPPVIWNGATFTWACANCFRLAIIFAVQHDLVPLPLGALAIGLITDPRTAAAQALGITTHTDHEEILQLVAEDLLGFDP